MLLLFDSLIIIILDIFFQRNKVLTIVNFAFMWILMGWSFGNADYEIYLNRYNYPSQYSTLEPLYSVLQSIFRDHGLQYYQFLIIMSGVFLLLRFLVVYGLTERQNLVYGLYLLYPFIFDVTQVREFYAISVVMVAVYFLVKLRRYNIISFVILVYIASLIHSSAIWYLMLLIPFWDKGSVKKFFKKSVFFFLTLLILSVTGALNKILNAFSNILGFDEKYSQTFTVNQYSYTQNNRYVVSLEIVIIFLLLFFTFYISKSCFYNKSNIFFNIEGAYQFIMKTNIVMLLLIPFLWQSADIYRIQQGFLMIFYTFFSFFITDEGLGKISSRNLFSIMILLVLASFFLYLIISVPSLSNSVFWPTFLKNTF